jgi:hypothetical protein
MRTVFKRIAVIVFLAPVLVLGLTGCGNLTSESDTTSASESSVAQQIGTNGQLISIQSDNVRAAGYDEASMVMTVQFGNGALYEYYGVPADLWTSFVAAQPHPWSQVGYPRLVQGGIPYKRIG